MTTTEPPSQSAILRIRAVSARTGLARPTLYKLIKEGNFPAGVALMASGKAVGWPEQDVNNWINERIAASRAHSESQP